MLSRAIGRYIRMSPKKARLVIDMIRGKSVDEALSLLPNVNRKASEYVEELVRSALNNAMIKEENKDLTEDAIFISKITADGGPALVRYRAASMGRASMIRKRTSHITVELNIIPEKLKEIEAAKEKTKTKAKDKVKGKGLLGRRKKLKVAKGTK